MMRLIKLIQNIKKVEPLHTFLIIRSEGKSALISNPRGQERSIGARIMWGILWYVIPMIASLGGIFWGNQEIQGVIKSFENLAGVAIPLFMGAFFSLLLAIPSSVDKLQKMGLDEGTFSRGKKAYKQLASIMQFQILLCFAILLLWLLRITMLCILKWGEYIYGLLSIILLFRFIVTIIYLIIRYHYLVKIEIK
ncbi:hypothetical protein [uncultured Porphyromonas sp.]|uniref:hypothetical protein n=1 Tax=uncultured Porphyromonas sp. TaxID=159274 RepID=UPI002616117F|nr:hypothetical protein [uncultured Porphyromonas sp.]